MEMGLGLKLQELRFKRLGERALMSENGDELKQEWVCEVTGCVCSSDGTAVVGAVWWNVEAEKDIEVQWDCVPVEKKV
ncbi:hypothetical protein C5167_013721 [Papaver somniferum]|uniref:Uncharacterized protein n=1 Tax=Papaver somniferum TaxID=3469 RepID=A0A4Y7J246_PAPSO|nr:hypothetical protein C5167_013721 [Papaver somniferum]